MRSAMRAFPFLAALLAAVPMTVSAAPAPEPAASPATASLVRMTEGLVEKIDKATGKVTVQHGPIDHLQLPPMSMQFRVKDPAWMDKIRRGDRILFFAERADGGLTITRLTPAR